MLSAASANANASATAAAARQLPPRHHRCSPSRAARHPDYMAMQQEPLKPAVVKERPHLEADPRYRRLDDSAELAATARLQFAQGLAAGEAQMQLARQALLIAAEDDAIASSSVVPFPTDAFLGRMASLAASTAAALAAAAPPARASLAGGGNEEWASLRSMPPDQVAAGIQHALFKQQPQQQQQVQQQWYRSVACAGYSIPDHGCSRLPPNALVDHPGVWEDARLAYLSEALVRRRGSPAVMAVLASEVHRQMLLLGAIDFAVTFDYGDGNTLAWPVPLPNMTLQQLMLSPPDASSSSSSSSNAGRSRSSLLLNTCSSEVLAELLRHLKRSYWPFSWDTSLGASSGGFRAAAKAALGNDEMSAALRAVSATAAHRLQRGIWTSPGAGDLNRCLAAAERLVMMVGDEQPSERRDLAVLLLHAGYPAAAAAELSAYLDSTRQEDPFDVRLARELRSLLRDTGVVPARDVVSTEAMLASGGRGVRDTDSHGEEQYKPLTW